MKNKIFDLLIKILKLTRPPNQIKKMITPTDTKETYITSEYNENRNGRLHKGLDIGSVQRPLKVFATVDAVVLKAGMSTSTGTGNRIWLKGKRDNLFYFYCHLSEIFVKEQQEVSAGQPIGRIGDTGCKGQIHLHFEVRKDISSNTTAINPTSIREKYLSKKEFYTK